MDSLCVFQRLLLRSRFAVLRGHLVPRFLCGSLCKLLRRCVWALGTLEMILVSLRGSQEPAGRARAGKCRVCGQPSAERRTPAADRQRTRSERALCYHAEVPGDPDRRAELTQLVECQLPKLDVAGSTPVLRSISRRRRLFCLAGAGGKNAGPEWPLSVHGPQKRVGWSGPSRR